MTASGAPCVGRARLDATLARPSDPTRPPVDTPRQRTETRFESVFAALPLRALLLDHSFRVLAANHAAMLEAGRSSEELLGESIFALDCGSEFAALHACYRRVMATRVAESVFVARTAADGSHRWFEHFIEPVPDGLCVFALDVTERERSDEVRRAHVQKLLRAQDEEHRRIALELHDELGQTLAALELSLARLEHDGGHEFVQSRAVELRAIVRRATLEVRRLTRGLHPTVLDDHGLEPALERLVTDSQCGSGVPVTLSVRGTGDLPRDAAIAIYRIVQEAVTNALRHGKPSSVRVAVHRAGRLVSGSVDDDGAGFLPGASQRDGIGLRGMCQRVQDLGGLLSVTSRPGAGTCVRFEFRVPGSDPPPSA